MVVKKWLHREVYHKRCSHVQRLCKDFVDVSIEDIWRPSQFLSLREEIRHESYLTMPCQYATLEQS